MQETRSPLPSGHGPTTTADEVLEREVRSGADVAGKVVVITGGYSGLGLEVTRVLAAAGARVVVPARDEAKASRVLRGMTGVEVEVLDLGEPASIGSFAQRFTDSGRSIDVLINNAGIMAVPLHHDHRGFEQHLAVNHLGHVALTQRLWPALVAGSGGRVVNLTSRAYRFSRFDFDDPQYVVREYDKWAAYGQSMTAKAMFAVELDRRAHAHGVRAFAVHPGTIVTDLARHLTRAELVGLGAMSEKGQVLQPPGSKSIAQGAATTVWAAIGAGLEGRGGLYLDDVDVAPLVDSSTDLFGPGVDAWLLDPAETARLWRRTEDLLGSPFLAPA